ncbi:unnamed protein product [Caretta caretta]
MLQNSLRLRIPSNSVDPAGVSAPIRDVPSILNSLADALDAFCAVAGNGGSDCLGRTSANLADSHLLLKSSDLASMEP